MASRSALPPRPTEINQAPETGQRDVWNADISDVPTYRVAISQSFLVCPSSSARPQIPSEKVVIPDHYVSRNRVEFVRANHRKQLRMDVELQKARRAVMEALGEDWLGSQDAMEVEEVLLNVMTGRRRTGRERPAQVETAQRYGMF